MTTKPVRTFAAVMVMVLLMVASGEAVYRDNGPTGPVPGKFIVKLKPQTRMETLNQSLGRGNRLENTFFAPNPNRWPRPM
jgi:hypothetical protein